MVQSDVKCCFFIPLHTALWIYAVVQFLGALSLVVQIVLFPALIETWLPMLIACTIMFVFVISLLCVKSLDTHKNRLTLFNMYVVIPVILYNCWYFMAIFNDFWVSAPYVMCRDTTNNPPPMNTPAFDDCMRQIRSHTSIDLCINLSLGLYLSYIIKAWADLKKDEEDDAQTG